jgi:starvation-inducible DNA-binding protein
MSNKAVATQLKNVLADTYALFTKTHGYHWNVEGVNFAGLHSLFEGQYTELFAAVDLLAERIRALGEKAPGSGTEFKKLSSVADGNAGFDDLRMIKDLYESNLLVVTTIKKALTTAEKASDVSTADLLTQRITAHEKAAWMLKASLPANAKVKLAV